MRDNRLPVVSFLSRLARCRAFGQFQALSAMIGPRSLQVGVDPLRDRVPVFLANGSRYVRKNLALKGKCAVVPSLGWQRGVGPRSASYSANGLGIAAPASTEAVFASALPPLPSNAAQVRWSIPRLCRRLCFGLKRPQI